MPRNPFRPSSGDPAPDLQALTALETVQRLERVLEEEFDALKARNIDRLEALQHRKLEWLQALSRSAKAPLANTSNADADMSGLSASVRLRLQACMQAHRRNKILATRQLDAIRGALRAMEGDSSPSAVEVYDRLGQVSRGGRGRASYSEA